MMFRKDRDIFFSELESLLSWYVLSMCSHHLLVPRLRSKQKWRYDHQFITALSKVITDWI